jgi:hypothetical protein
MRQSKATEWLLGLGILKDEVEVSMPGRKTMDHFGECSPHR